MRATDDENAVETDEETRKQELTTKDKKKSKKDKKAKKSKKEKKEKKKRDVDVEDKSAPDHHQAEETVISIGEQEPKKEGAVEEVADISKEEEEGEDNSIFEDPKIKELEAFYRKALEAFKTDKTSKDLRRAKTAAKKAWDTALIEAAGPGFEPLTCRNCSQLFLFGDKDKFKEKGWAKPSQCKKCTFKIGIARSKDRKRVDQKQNMCYEFQQTGECSRGDRCRFSHLERHIGKKRRIELDAAKEEALDAAKKETSD
ncbi:unnamed protein product [Cylindrotheca closterium]|uniref:C3H1-type domain-containing protein n=1 Tax=Cylindrotheca closterium TaxID=2856 RepID=A0AAD2FVL5_9STRA|nr:unnamed protein product [Cylindrotheca closterium]